MPTSAMNTSTASSFAPQANAPAGSDKSPPGPRLMVHRNKSNRLQLLTQIYHDVQADIGLELVPASLYDLGADLGLSPEETEAAVNYGYAKGYLAYEKHLVSQGDQMRLFPTYMTVEGIEYIESVLTTTLVENASLPPGSMASPR